MRSTPTAAKTITPHFIRRVEAVYGLCVIADGPKVVPSASNEGIGPPCGCP